MQDLAEAFRRRQHERVFDLYNPEIEWDARRTPTGAAEGIYHGHEGVRAFWRDWLSAWSDLHFEIDDVRDAGDDVVLLIRNQRHWGRASAALSFGSRRQMPASNDLVALSVRRANTHGYGLQMSLGG